MKKIVLLMSVCLLVWAEPDWIHNPTYNGEYIGAVGIAEAYFPEHVKERVAYVRARAALLNMQKVDTGVEMAIQNKNSIEEASAMKSLDLESKRTSFTIKEKFKDKEGVLYLWVVHN